MEVCCAYTENMPGALRLGSENATSVRTEYFSINVHLGKIPTMVFQQGVNKVTSVHQEIRKISSMVTGKWET